MNKRCYIAGPITGIPREVYRFQFEQAKKELKVKGFEPVSPVDLPHEHEGKTWADYMREDLAAMLSCDTVYALKDWQKSKGATIEINLALALGIDIIHQR